ncbi:MAG: cardiolipin synthase [Eubacterium sp.]|nr:cardiolipin synthase [Eubacterium sp.]
MSDIAVKEHKKSRKNRPFSGLNGRVESSMSGFIRAFVVLILVLVQFFVIIAVPFLLGQFSGLFFVLMEGGGILAILLLTNDNRSMHYKFGWLCIIVVLPIAGIIMFLMFGRVGKSNKLNRRIEYRFSEVDKNLEFYPEISEKFRADHPVSRYISGYMEAEGSPLYKNNTAKYYEMGELVLEDIFEKLESAEKFIFLEFFIVGEGALWDKLSEVLSRKVSQGVEVKFIYDDFGALTRTKTSFASSLRALGVEVEVFNPISKYVSKLYMNFRTHQKIVVIDGKYAYTGGFNIADEYANLVERFGVWKDAGIRITGDAVFGMTIAFLEMWYACKPYEKINIEKYKNEEKSPESETYCHVLRDGPALGPRSFIGNTYRQIAQYAQKKLYIMTPYLMPEDTFIDTLIEAVERGVDVRIITPNIPDKKRIKTMTEYNYGPLLKNGIRIYEYTPGFIHSKVILNDHSTMVGTVNVDYRSFYLHYENSIWVYDKKFHKSILDDFEETFKISHEFTYDEWKDRPTRRKIAQFFLHVFDALV